MAVLAAVALLCAGCLSIQEPPPSAGPHNSSAASSVVPRDPNALIVAVPADPQTFLPPATDETSALLVDLLYDPLYRLDTQLQPQPDLASDLPRIAADGLTWNVPLRAATFSAGASVTAADVAFSLQLAQSHNCPFGRDLCGTVSDNLSTVVGTAPKAVSITLRQPYAPFLTTVLGQLPILSAEAVRLATQKLAAGAAKLDKTEPRRRVNAITDATNQDACLGNTPPFGCKLSDYTSQLEKLLHDAAVALPPRERFLGPTAQLDAEAYAGALLDRVSALDEVLNGSGVDQAAAALPMFDPSTTPLGSGPYSLQSYTPGTGLRLVANADHPGGAPHIPRISMQIVRDPAVAATMLLTGDADWLLHVDAAQLGSLGSVPGVTATPRPAASERVIVFNVRPGRVYSDVAARQAFGLCLDRDALVKQAGAGALPARTPVAAGSWAMAPPAPAARNVAGALKLLQSAGWTRGTDGIFAKGGKRLSSSIAVRPSRTDLLAFANGAAQQLADCGIELTVRQLDLTGDLLLSQLQWPNDFDTVLLARDLGTDPDQDVRPFESSHATSADNPADSNPGGYAAPDVDALIAKARAEPDVTARAALYAQLQTLLDRDAPYWPIWYDTSTSALSDRVVTPAGPVEAGANRYWWNLETWSLGSH